MTMTLTEVERKALAIGLIDYETRSWAKRPDPAELLDTDPANWRCINAVDAVEFIVPVVEAILRARAADLSLNSRDLKL